MRLMGPQAPLASVRLTVLKRAVPLQARSIGASVEVSSFEESQEQKAQPTGNPD